MTVNIQLDRSVILVDTGYLVSTLLSCQSEVRGKDILIDMRALPDTVRELVELDVKQNQSPHVFRQYWYDGPIGGPYGSRRSAFGLAEGVVVREGYIREWNGRTIQKAVDTRIVADMVKMSIKGEVSHIYLLTGDLDMLPGVQMAVEHGVIVNLVTLRNPYIKNVSDMLMRNCDRTIKLEAEMFDSCIQRLERQSDPVTCIDRDELVGDEQVWADHVGDEQVGQRDGLDLIDEIMAKTETDADVDDTDIDVPLDSDPDDDLPKYTIADRPSPSPNPAFMARVKPKNLHFVDIQEGSPELHVSWVNSARRNGIGRGSRAYQAGVEFADQWLNGDPSDQDIISAHNTDVQLPYQLDSRLIRFTSQYLAVEELNSNDRTYMRNGFRDEVTSRTIVT